MADKNAKPVRRDVVFALYALYNTFCALKDGETLLQTKVGEKTLRFALLQAAHPDQSRNYQQEREAFKALVASEKKPFDDYFNAITAAGTKLSVPPLALDDHAKVIEGRLRDIILRALIAESALRFSDGQFRVSESYSPDNTFHQMAEAISALPKTFPDAFRAESMKILQAIEKGVAPEAFKKLFDLGDDIVGAIQSYCTPGKKYAVADRLKAHFCPWSSQQERKENALDAFDTTFVRRLYDEDTVQTLSRFASAQQRAAAETFNGGYYNAWNKYFNHGKGRVSENAHYLLRYISHQDLCYSDLKNNFFQNDAKRLNSILHYAVWLYHASPDRYSLDAKARFSALLDDAGLKKYDAEPTGMVQNLSMMSCFAHQGAMARKPFPKTEKEVLAWKARKPAFTHFTLNDVLAEHNASPIKAFEAAVRALCLYRCKFGMSEKKFNQYFSAWVYEYLDVAKSNSSGKAQRARAYYEHLFSHRVELLHSVMGGKWLESQSDMDALVRGFCTELPFIAINIEKPMAQEEAPPADQAPEDVPEGPSFEDLLEQKQSEALRIAESARAKKSRTRERRNMIENLAAEFRGVYTPLVAIAKQDASAQLTVEHQEYYKMLLNLLRGVALNFRSTKFFCDQHANVNSNNEDWHSCYQFMVRMRHQLHDIQSLFPLLKKEDFFTSKGNQDAFVGVASSLLRRQTAGLKDTSMYRHRESRSWAGVVVKAIVFNVFYLAYRLGRLIRKHYQPEITSEGQYLRVVTSASLEGQARLDGLLKKMEPTESAPSDDNVSAAVKKPSDIKLALGVEERYADLWFQKTCVQEASARLRDDLSKMTQCVEISV